MNLQRLVPAVLITVSFFSSAVCRAAEAVPQKTVATAPKSMPDPVARVNGTPIAAADLNKAYKALSASQGGAQVPAGKELEARVEGISAYLRSPYAVEDELIGFVTPVYCYALPPLVKDFLQKAQFKAPQYLFGVATMGAMVGQTLNQAEHILSQRDMKLQAGFKLALPDSSIVFPSPAK